MFYGRDARAEAGSGAHATLSIAAARTEEGGCEHVVARGGGASHINGFNMKLHVILLISLIFLNSNVVVRSSGDGAH